MPHYIRSYSIQIVLNTSDRRTSFILNEGIMKPAVGHEVGIGVTRPNAAGGKNKKCPTSTIGA